VHYAGHGYHDQRFPERSKIFLWEEEGQKGSVKELTANALRRTLRMRGHSLRFVYLSCCSSGATSDETALLNGDFLGMGESLILMGIPSVLGFRWPVSDGGAKQLARTFYQSLFEQREDLDTALFQARCKVCSENPDESDWLSPILIAQE
jgi:CHAT domain-containing protein